MQDFVVGFARSAKSPAKTKKAVKCCLPGKSLGDDLSYNFRKVKADKTKDNQRQIITKKTKRTADVYCCQREVQHVTYKNLASALRVSNGTIHNILQDDLGLIEERFFHWNNALFHTVTIVPM